MSENLLIPLPGFSLPTDFPWRVRFIAAVDEQLRRLRATGHFVPPRFFGYFFQGDQPMAVSGSWTVTLDPASAISQLPAALARVTLGQFTIASHGRDIEPDFMLVHDRRDGACWLWRYSYGMRFVESTEPIVADMSGTDGAENRKLLGP